MCSTSVAIFFTAICTAAMNIRTTQTFVTRIILIITLSNSYFFCLFNFFFFKFNQFNVVLFFQNCSSTFRQSGATKVIFVRGKHPKLLTVLHLITKIEC